MTNEASAGGVPRAPAYDVTVTSVTDPSDQLYVDPLATDVLDNDGDTLEDAADTERRRSRSLTTSMLNGVPAEVIAVLHPQRRRC